MIYSAEHVTAWHPDKICDQISDAILDACLIQDANSRVAVETMGGHGQIYLTGEITSKATVDYAKIAQDVYTELIGKQINITSNIVSQSPEISQGVDTGGAGDQGVMIGYACVENESLIPLETYLARKILAPVKTDGKSQVTIRDGEVESIVLSVQGKTQEELDTYIKQLNPSYQNVYRYCNNTGSFETGGFDADAGVTGRKIVVDAYGPRVPVGGGAFSGKDPTKVDRSAAYMARFIALNLLYKYSAREVLVKLGYVIGSPYPLIQTATINGGEEVRIEGFDCRPQAIIERFNLKRPIYQQTARYGHFGNRDLPWEKM